MTTELERLRAEVEALRIENQQLYEDILRLRDLQNVAALLATEENTDAAVRAALDCAMRITAACSSRFYQPAGHSSAPMLRMTAAVEGGSFLQSEVPAGIGIAATVLRRGRVVNCPDVSRDRRHHPAADLVCGMSGKSVLAVPVASRGEVLGVIEVVRSATRAFDDDDLEYLQALAAHAAGAIARDPRRRRVDPENSSR